MENNNLKNDHESILKSTGLFGFAQLFKMIIGVVSSKFVAIFLGPTGIGLVGLLTNIINIISSISSFGFSFTSVREMSLANSQNDEKALAEKMNLLQKWAIIIGFFGAFITIIFSGFLSKITFGNTSKYYWFVILSINFLIISLTTFRIAILQGTRMLKQIALSNVVTSLIISIFTIPIYYFLKFKGIIPVILISSIIGLAVNYYYSRKVVTFKTQIPFSEIITKGKPMMKMGFLLSINVIFGYICTYLIKLYLNGNGTTAEILGFYEVSTVILVSYVGMIFNAMGTDFYPKLTSIENDNNAIKNIVNNQIEIALLLVVPAIIGLYFTSPILINLLYSKAFLGVLEILKIALFSVIIKAIVWPLAFIILAKGDKKQYFKQELVSDFFNITFTIFFYQYFKLIGIGIALVLNYIIYSIYVFLIVKNKYNFSFTIETKKIILKSLAFGILATIFTLLWDYPFAYFPLGILFILSLIFSFLELNKRVNIKSILTQLKRKFFNKS